MRYPKLLHGLTLGLFFFFFLLMLAPVYVSASDRDNAAEYCRQNGGTIEENSRWSLGTFDVCIFKYNYYYQCESLALLKGDCPIGGIDTERGYTRMEKYCALIGGEVVKEKGYHYEMNMNIMWNLCKLKNGSLCETTQLFTGKCSSETAFGTLAELESSKITDKNHASKKKISEKNENDSISSLKKNMAFDIGFFTVLIALIVLWIIALYGALIRKDLKLKSWLWILIILFMGIIGPIAYFFTEKRIKLGIAFVLLLLLAIVYPIINLLTL